MQVPVHEIYPFLWFILKFQINKLQLVNGDNTEKSTSSCLIAINPSLEWK